VTYENVSSSPTIDIAAIKVPLAALAAQLQQQSGVMGATTVEEVSVVAKTAPSPYLTLKNFVSYFVARIESKILYNRHRHKHKIESSSRSNNNIKKENNNRIPNPPRLRGSLHQQ